MELVILMALGVGLLGSQFVKIPIAGIEMVYVCIGLLLCYYVYEVIVKRRLKMEHQEWLLFAFLVYACASVVFSLTGITRGLVSERLPVDLRYLARQAYYLAILPAALLTVPTKGKRLAEQTLDRYDRVLFFVIYVFVVLTRKGMTLPTVFLIAFLSLRDQKPDKLDWLMFVMVLLAPRLVEGGEMTNVLLRLIYAVCFLFRKRSKFILWGLAGGIWFCVGLCFLAPLFLEQLEALGDPNTLWRAQFWGDELKMLAESHYLGVGYGTAYCSRDFIDPAVYIPWGPGDPFVNTAQYSVYDKVFVTGAHNSFVTVAFRLGIVGIALFVGYLLWLHIRQLRQIQKVSLRTYYALCGSVVLIALNVGLESPYYMLLFLLAICYSGYQLKR